MQYHIIQYSFRSTGCTLKRFWGWLENGFSLRSWPEYGNALRDTFSIVQSWTLFITCSASVSICSRCMNTFYYFLCIYFFIFSLRLLCFVMFRSSIPKEWATTFTKSTMKCEGNEHLTRFLSPASNIRQNLAHSILTLFLYLCPVFVVSAIRDALGRKVFNFMLKNDNQSDLVENGNIENAFWMELDMDGDDDDALSRWQNWNIRFHSYTKGRNEQTSRCNWVSKAEHSASQSIN